MKLFNTAIYATLLSLSASTTAAVVNQNDAVYVPISIGFTEPVSSFTATWNPKTNLVAGEHSSTFLGQIVLSKTGDYAVKIDTNDDESNPHIGRLIKEGISDISIPVRMLSITGQEFIKPDQSGGVAGWSIRTNTNAFNIYINAPVYVTAGTYKAGVTIATVTP